MIRFSYPNSELIKTKNKRCHIFKQEDSYYVEFAVLSEDHKPRALHQVDRGIVTTGLQISTEGALALMIALREQLKKDGVI